MSKLDYFGVNPECGCVTAWMSDDHSTAAEVGEFYSDMAKTGREVRRMELTDETRRSLTTCPHKDRPTTPESAQALEDATTPVNDPKQDELLAEDGFDV